jgi:hypothetical protein
MNKAISYSIEHCRRCIIGRAEIEESCMSDAQNAIAENSPDNGDRIRDFYARHGGPAARQGSAAETVPGVSGWSEVYAADGYTLRCDWSRSGSLHRMQFNENPPGWSGNSQR